jgi:hypothetical protein
MPRSQRLRWIGLGVLAGALGVVGIIVVVAIATSKNQIDANDAAKVATRWAAEHRRSGERYDAGDCYGDAGGFRFVCHIRYRPTNRRFSLFLRKTAEGGDYSVVLSHVDRGTHPLPDFPDTIRKHP